MVYKEKLINFIKNTAGYILLFLVILLFTSLARNISIVKRYEERIENKKLDIQKLEEEKRNYQEELENITSQEHVEAQLRNNLGLVKEGETVVVLPDDEVIKKLASQIVKEKPQLPDPNWLKWAKLFGFLN